MIRVFRLLLSITIVMTSLTFFAQDAIICPLPSGTTPPDDPSVTAEEVEADNSNLQEFAVSVRAQVKKYLQGVRGLEQIAYFGCKLREETGVWRADSIYNIFLLPDGRVYFHANEMRLVGRLLSPQILHTIFTELGVPSSVISDLSSSDPASVARARAALFATLSREPDAHFDASVGSETQPGIPGAEGYATAYLGRILGLPIIILSGFDLKESHLADEVFDYGDPIVSASEVVDRETLKQFVTAAGEYRAAIQRTGNPSHSTRTKVAFRDPNGPWRHGSVYLYILDITSRIVTFHATQPDRFEFRPLTATVVDAVTGEFILPQILAAARSGPEGGYVRYYYDDPTVDTDNADTPKVAFAREFTGFLAREGVTREFKFIVVSAFYLTAPGVVAVRQNNIVDTVLPQILRTFTTGTTDSISNRVGNMTDGSDSTNVLKLAGLPRLWDYVLSSQQHTSDSTKFLHQLASNSSFNLPLKTPGTKGNPLSNLTLWGSADYRSLSDEDEQSGASHEGDVVNVSVGIDRELSKDFLGGVALTVGRSSVDYIDPETAMGEFRTSITSINPYIGWRLSQNSRAWASFGYGWGEIEFEESTNAQASDLSQSMFAAGIHLALMSSDQWFSGGTTNLEFQGETSLTTAEVEGAGSLKEVELTANRHRARLKGSYVKTLDSNATLSPSLNIGYRYDDGDGETENNFEFGSAISYSAGRLQFELRAQTLLGQTDSDGYEEWGISSSLSYLPNSDGRNLSISVSSSNGFTDNPTHHLWARGADENFDDTRQYFHATQRFNFEVGYGLAAQRSRAVWSPYLGLDTDGNLQSFRTGLQYRSARGIEGGLEIGQYDRLNQSTSHAILLRGTMYW